MRYSFPTVDIYVPKNITEEYLVQRYMEHPQFGYSQGTGDPIRLDRASMEKEGAELVYRLLLEYPTQADLGIPSLYRAPRLERKEFFRNYLTITLTMYPENRLEFCVVDMNEVGESGTGRDEDAITIPVPFSPDQFLQALDTTAQQGLQGKKSRR